MTEEAHKILDHGELPEGRVTTVTIGRHTLAALIPVVVGLPELPDAAAVPVSAADGVEGPELEGLASVAGLVEMAVFLGVGALIARPIRPRLGGVVQ